MATRALNSGKALARRLRFLQAKRRDSRVENAKERARRKALTPGQRAKILEKTGGRCHICGGRIKRGARWAADHILAYAHGGEHDVANYLPAHRECNKIRSYFQPEEFRWIMKLGVWFRTRIAREHPLAMRLAERFAAHARANEVRRKGSLGG